MVAPQPRRSIRTSGSPYATDAAEDRLSRSVGCVTQPGSLANEAGSCGYLLAREPITSTSQRQASYLKDSETRARYATTLPPSTFMSSLLTSAMRKSRSDFAAVSTALLAA